MKRVIAHTFVLTILVGCKDVPAICTGEVAPKSLPLYANCGYGDRGGPNDPCKDGVCLFGICAERCQEDNDCQRWDGFDGACTSEGGCIYLCVRNPNSSLSRDAFCPMVDEIQMECGHLFCEAPDPCED